MESQSCQLNTSVPADGPTSYRHYQPAKKMRCLIDGRKLGHGGVGVYTENLIFGLAALDRLELSVLVRSAQNFPSLDTLGVNWVQAPASVRLHREVFLGQLVDQSNYDLYHAPHYTLLPFGLKIPSVVTIHDAIHVYHPQRFFYPFIARPLIKSALRRAGRVVTVSQASATDLNRLVPVASDKIVVIPNAVDPYFMQQPPKSAPPLEYLGRSGAYLLCNLSQYKPHKGLRDLLNAFKQLGPRLDSHLPTLALVGQGTSTSAVTDLVKSLELESHVVILGSVSKEKLRTLYSRALALIVPSLYEGSSLPTLEAKACGLRIVARPCPSVVELLNSADVVCTDFSVGALAAGIEQVLDVEQSLNARLLPDLTDFSRQAVASQTWTVYQQLLERR